MVKHIVFDFGNVLVHFDPLWLYEDVFEGDRERAMWFNEHVATGAWVRRLDAGEPMGQCVAELQAQWPQYAREIALYDTRYYEMVGPEMEGMRPLLERLKGEGYGLWGLTNWPPKIYHVLETHPIFGLLDGMVISSEEHLTKPDARIYQCLLDRYGLTAEDCVFTDDVAANVVAAQAVGMRGILFRNALQLEHDLREMIGG